MTAWECVSPIANTIVSHDEAIITDRPTWFPDPHEEAEGMPATKRHESLTAQIGS